MKRWTLSLLIGIAMLITQRSFAGRCTGKAVCYVCTNYSSCKYCNELGGTCGKCRTYGTSIGNDEAFWSSKMAIDHLLRSARSCLIQ